MSEPTMTMMDDIDHPLSIEMTDDIDHPFDMETTHYMIISRVPTNRRHESVWETQLI